MNLIHADLSSEKLYDLFRELHLITFSNSNNEQPTVNEAYTVERICKCYDLDVNLQLKMHINQFIVKDTGTYTVCVKVSVKTDATTLRKIRNGFNEYEYFFISKELPPHSDAQLVLDLYKQLVKEILTQLNAFKVCKHCRLLYKDPRQDEIEPNYPCIHCIFDDVFHIRDCRCVVCNEDLLPEDASFTLTCGHTFHTECILLSFLKTKSRACPLCREHDTHELP